jgi:hypothetical protein
MAAQADGERLGAGEQIRLARSAPSASDSQLAFSGLEV